MLVSALLAWVLLQGPMTPASLALQRSSSMEYPRIECIITVIASGQPVAGLAAKDIQATLGGRQLLVEEVVALREPAHWLDAAVLLDESGSMAGETGKTARLALRDLVDRLHPADRVRILSFSGTIRPLAEWVRSGLFSVESIANEGTNSGATALRDCVAAAVTQFPVGAPRRAVIAITDGQDTASMMSVDDLIAAACAANVALCFVKVGSSAAPWLDVAARATTGMAAPLLGPATLREVYAAVAPGSAGEYQVRLRDTAPTPAVVAVPLVLRVVLAGAEAEAETEVWTSAQPSAAGAAAPAFMMAGAGEGLILGSLLIANVVVIGLIVCLRRHRTGAGHG